MACHAGVDQQDNTFASLVLLWEKYMRQQNAKIRFSVSATLHSLHPEIDCNIYHQPKKHILRSITAHTYLDQVN